MEYIEHLELKNLNRTPVFYLLNMPFGLPPEDRELYDKQARGYFTGDNDPYKLWESGQDTPWEDSIIYVDDPKIFDPDVETVDYIDPLHRTHLALVNPKNNVEPTPNDGKTYFLIDYWYGAMHSLKTVDYPTYDLSYDPSTSTIVIQVHGTDGREVVLKHRIDWEWWCYMYFDGDYNDCAENLIEGVYYQGVDEPAFKDGKLWFGEEIVRTPAEFIEDIVNRSLQIQNPLEIRPTSELAPFIKL